MNRAESDWQTALSAWNDALAAYKAHLARGRIDSDYYAAGRRARRALKRCFRLAYQQRREWTPGECRTFY